MNYRGWLNDDPASNETIDFILPRGSIVPKVWEERLYQYYKASQRHMAQYYIEVVALKLICLQYKLPKDLFNLLKNKYICRPVKKLQPNKTLSWYKKYDEDELRSLFVGIVFCFCFAIIIIGIYVTLYL